MSMPSGEDGTGAQILVKLGEMGAQLAVIGEQLKSIPDHETRLRSLERDAVDVPDHEQRLRALERARWPWPTVAAVAAVGAAVAAWASFLHH